MQLSRTCLVSLLTLLSFGTQAARAQGDSDDATKQGGFEFDVETIDGERLTGAQLHDKVVLIDFWGTWCPPCKKAIPHLVKLYEKYEARGLVIVGLNYEKEENALELVRNFADKNGIAYPLALGTEAIKAQVKGFGGYPTMLFFKRGMRLDRQETGFSEDKVAAMEAWIVEALAEEAPPDAPEVVQPTRAVLEKGDRKLAVGDGSKSLLVVVSHPKARPDAATLERLRGLAAERSDVEVVTLDIGGGSDATDADFVATKGPLKSLGLGHAAPAYRLFDPTGRAVMTEVGRGAKVHATVISSLEELVKKNDGAKTEGAKNEGATDQSKAAEAQKEDAHKEAASKRG
ncbi:MAG TPA: TlpA disulfide reductase family protein [Planctomycetota bacterium]|nr:TlpA disulfide reductase family protein [Planctomycetota bacterium]